MTPLSDSEAATVRRFEAAEPAPESWGGGLRRAARLALAQWSVVPLTHIGYIADGVLEAIEPEVAALRAKADAADRVRGLHRPLDRGTGPQCQGCATNVTFTPWPCPTIRALDGPQC